MEWSTWSMHKGLVNGVEFDRGLAVIVVCANKALGSGLIVELGAARCCQFVEFELCIVQSIRPVKIKVKADM
ncbi:hypothetical protein TWF679_004415 [Orbilia oligospora]|uniref:Uncharacterized protein n=1 Tax=Orbilia oligospora TaxID=2813651 RepID=A0A8H8VE45_ORBOL|nr:hypothetical protein TWF679_004415 [Orbilia oligospora]